MGFFQGNLSDKALFIMKMTEKAFDIDEILILKDSDLLSETIKQANIEEYSSKGCRLIYLDRQCIEAYLYDEKVVEKYFKTLGIIASNEFYIEWNKKNFKDDKNTGHIISDQKVKLIGQEIFSVKQKTTPKIEIQNSLAEIIRDMGKVEEEEGTSNIYWQLYKSIFGEI